MYSRNRLSGIPLYAMDALIVFAASVYAVDPLFDPAVNYGAGDDPQSVFSADFNGDCNHDLAVANLLSDNKQWWPMQSWIRRGTVPNLFSIER